MEKRKTVMEQSIITTTSIRNIFILAFNKYQRYIKYVIVGGFGCLINWTILYCLTEFAGLWYIGSAVIGIVVAATSNYFVNHHWTFRNERKHNSNMTVGWFRYQLITGICSLIYIGMLALFTEVFGIWYMFSAIMAVFISSTTLFLTIRKWVWGKPRR